MKIKLPKKEYDRMLAHALEKRPEEACGLIAGHDSGTEEGMVRTIEKVYCLANTDHSAEHFTLDPKEQLAAVRDMRAKGMKPLGNWHSHPETPSRPSDEDKRLAFDRHASYLILSLADADRPVLNAFTINGNDAHRDELEIIR